MTARLALAALFLAGCTSPTPSASPAPAPVWTYTADTPSAKPSKAEPLRVSRSRPPQRTDKARTMRGQRAVRRDGLNWHALARCESGNNPQANTGNGYYGAYQFDLRTWRSVGGSGYPHRASLAEQTYRAQLLYKSRGRSPWPTCGRLL